MIYKFYKIKYEIFSKIHTDNMGKIFIVVTISLSIIERQSLECSLFCS